MDPTVAGVGGAGHQFTPGTAVYSTSTVEVSIAARGLKDTDVLSKSDPMCVIYQKQLLGTNAWTEILRTETIWDNLNPDFVTKLMMDYRFEEEQPLRFELYDIDDPHSHSLAVHDFLGFAECSLAQIIASGYEGLKLPLSGKTNVPYSPTALAKHPAWGFILLTSEEMQDVKEELALQLTGVNLGGSGGGFACCFISPRAFFILSKSTESSKYSPVHRSEEVQADGGFFKKFNLSLRTLCNGDRDRDLKLEFFQAGMNGRHTSLGVHHTTVNQLEQHARAGRQGPPIPIMKATTGSSSKGPSSTGAGFVVTDFRISRVFTFLDYITSGTQLHCCIAIDFTASNGDPNDRNSLHHFSALSQYTRNNPYEQAIESVVSILQEYDATKQFPVYGFGARLPPNGIVSHKFFVTMEPSPYCAGMTGVLANYRKCISQVQLAGPTCFAPIVKEVGSLAAATANQGGQHYYVLLIITDGVINDMNQTMEAIIQASTLPLSIIIVGVGHADFGAMEVLDGDTVRLSYGGRTASRDIVQFVPYRDAYTWLATSVAQPTTTTSALGFGDLSFQVAKTKLAQEVLAEIPNQLVSYMKSRGITPNVNANANANAHNL